MSVSRITRAARVAAADMMKPDPDPDVDATPAPEPEESVAEERQRVSRIALNTYQPHLLPWKFAGGSALAGIVVHNGDVGLFMLLCATPILITAGYWFTEWRLTSRHVDSGRVEMGDRTSRRVRRVKRRAARTARVAAALSVWLCLVSLTDPAGMSGLIVWTAGAIAWGLTSWKGWWEPLADDTITASAAPITASDAPAADGPAPGTAPATASGAPTVNRVPRGPRRASVPVPPADGQPAPASRSVVLPPPSLLQTNADPSKSSLERDYTATIQEVFTARNLDVQVIGEPQRGPAVTRYRLKASVAIPVNKILNMAKDLQLATGQIGLTVKSPVAGKPEIGVEVPNINRETIPLGMILNSPEAKNNHHPLLVALGKDEDGNFVLVTLAFLIHLLIAGATGGGKSGAINAIIMSLITRATPDEVRLLMIDPKRVELTPYNGIPHLLSPVITDPNKAANALDYVVEEVEQRYEAFEKNGVRNIDDYNLKVITGEIVAPPGAKHPLRPYAYWVVIVDELADLMVTVGEDIEKLHQRLTAKARAAGIHLVEGTQRPSVDVVTGIIKANIPSRLALACATVADSRTILDRGGAEKLLGKGDALMMPNGSSTITRLQIAWVDTPEIDAVVSYLRQYSPDVDSVLPESLLDAPRDSVATAKPTNTRDIVLAKARNLADDRGVVTKSQIIAATPGMNDKTRDAALSKLFASGDIVNKHGIYTLRPDGEDGQTPEEETQQ